MSDPKRTQELIHELFDTLARSPDADFRRIYPTLRSLKRRLRLHLKDLLAPKITEPDPNDNLVVERNYHLEIDTTDSDPGLAHQLAITNLQGEDVGGSPYRIEDPKRPFEFRFGEAEAGQSFYLEVSLPDVDEEDQTPHRIRINVVSEDKDRRDAPKPTT